ncbi:MAG: sigma-54-dependent Fis family transcriptional regulator [Bacteroidetes bacterium]|nr:sigma-54-dependent Fis family transcriptional regulator [Bacteroidota bacterium]
MNPDIKAQLQKIQDHLRSLGNHPLDEPIRLSVQKAFHDVMILEALLMKSAGSPDRGTPDTRLEQARTILGEKDLGKLLDFALDTLVAMTSANRGFLTTLSADGAVDVFTARRIGHQEVMDPGSQISRAILSDSLRQSPGQPLIISSRDQPGRYETIQRLEVGSVLAFPIHWEGELVAVLYLDRDETAEPFQTGFLPSLMEFCSMLAPRLFQLRRLRDLETMATPAIPENEFIYEGVIGNSGVFRDTIRITRRVAPSEATVLILGESGTGKELIARAIHRNSRRKSGPFVAVNCTAIPADLIESELFGHEKGAFTGALQRKPGKFEQAAEGTIFLDEIGDLPLDLQGKLLRAIQERTFDRVGGTQPVQVDVRVVAATNRNLRSMVETQQFREDLYYRLNVISLHLPPLRNRKTDIPLLVRHLLPALEQKNGLSGTVVADEAMEALVTWGWPGNIRELENVLERAMILCENGVIRLRDLPPEILDDAPDIRPSGEMNLEAQLAAFRQQLLLQALEKSAGNKSQAARLLGISRNYLHQLLNRQV